MISGKFIDLHMHLDGGITLETAKRLALIQNMTLPAANDDELKKLLTVPEGCESLNDFLRCFDLPVKLLQTPEALSEAAFLVLSDAEKQGDIYTEIRYAPQLHTNGGMNQEDAVNAVIKGMERAGIRSNIILCCMRGEGNEKQNYETLEVASKFITEDGGVTAVDIAGAEALFPTSKYRDLFTHAKELGIPFTIHAGEADGPESVRLAAVYGAGRIGHGVRTIEDEIVMKLVRDSGITLEMCPTSNRQTCSVKDMKKYPIYEYMDYGIPVTLNTDDPAIEDTTIEKEFRYIESLLGMTDVQRKKIMENSVNAAFTGEETKRLLKKELGL